MFSRFGHFVGGIDLPQQKHRTLNAPIRQCGPLESLCVPLAPCGGPAAEPIVVPGQRVSAGELLATAKGHRGVDIVAPASGLVGDIAKPVLVSVGAELLPSLGIELTELSHLPEPTPLENPTDIPEHPSAELRNILAESPLLVQRFSPEPLRLWLERYHDIDLSLLVLNVIQSQPYVTADHRLLMEFGEEILGGLAILGRALEATNLTLAVNQQRTVDYSHLPETAGGRRIESIALPRKYPIEADAILLKVLTKREIPCGCGPEAIGAAVIDAATCQAVFRYIVTGDVPRGRVVTLAGEKQPSPGNVLAPFGASPDHLAGPTRSPLTLGGPMVGKLHRPSAVLTGAIDAVLAFEPSARPASQPCLRCTWCLEHCPTRLNVSALNDLFEFGDIDAAARLGVASCVGCGVCSYICPAGLPLAHRTGLLKRAVLEKRQAMPLFSEEAS